MQVAAGALTVASGHRIEATLLAAGTDEHHGRPEAHLVGLEGGPPETVNVDAALGGALMP